MAEELLDVDALADVSLNGFDLANVVLRQGQLLLVQVQRAGLLIGNHAGGPAGLGTADELGVDDRDVGG